MLGYRIVTHLACASLYLAAAAFGSGAWISGETVDTSAWTRVQRDYGLCDAKVIAQDVRHEGTTIKISGAVLLALRDGRQAASGNNPATLQDVYYSGNAPYKNVPPEFALKRRTISNILCRIDPAWTPERVAVLTYGPRIIALLDELSGAGPEEAVQIGQDIMALADVHGVGALPTGRLWAAIDAILRARTAAGGAVVVPAADKESLTTLYEQEVSAYKATLENYRKQIGIPREKKRRGTVRHDYAVHCEVMFLYDIWCAADPELRQPCLVGGGRTAPVNRLFYDYRQRGHPLPRFLIISKPMCRSCEPLIVGAWTGVEQDLYVVTESKPSDDEERRHDARSRVKKIDSPLNGRTAYAPTA